MRSNVFTQRVVLALACACLLPSCTPKSQQSPGPDSAKNVAALTVTSSAFTDGQPIPPKHACGAPKKGECDLGISPPLTWTAGPAQTQSYAVLVCDPDGRDWLHWVASNLSATTTSLAEAASGLCKSSLPSPGVDGKNEFGLSGYGGPCPPAGSGLHHYIFTVYALPTAQISLPASNKCAEVKQALESQAIAKGTTTATYRIDR